MKSVVKVLMFLFLFVFLKAEDSVMVVVNANSPGSVEIGKYYAKKRKINDTYIKKIMFTGTEKIAYKEYIETVIPRIKDGLSSSTKSIVMCYETPFILTASDESDHTGGSFALDNFIRFLFDRADQKTLLSYFYDSRGNIAFEGVPAINGSMKAYNVTRLDGPSVKDVKGMIDRTIYAEQNVGPAFGMVYLDKKGVTDKLDNDYIVDSDIEETGKYLKTQAYEVITENTAEDFGKDKCPKALWYYGKVYQNRYLDAFEWLPGSIALHADFKVYDIRSDKCWISYAIKKGLTACVCSLDELKNPRFIDGTMFFKSFLGGTPLGESVYKAMPAIRYNLIIIGDPLYKITRAYKGKKPVLKILKAEFFPDVKSPDASGSIMAETEEFGYATILYGRDGKLDQTYEEKIMAQKHNLIVDYVAGKKYSYKIVFTDGFNNTGMKTGDFSSPANVLAPVQNVAATVKGGEVNLSWEKKGDIKGYKLYKKLEGDDYGEYVGELPAEAVSYSDKKVENGSRYTYYVRAFDEKGGLSNKGEVSAVPTPLIAVEGLKAEKKSTSVFLSWKKLADKAVNGYLVLRSSSPGGKFTELRKTINPDYSDYNIKKGETFYYKIRTMGVGDDPGSETEAIRVVF